MAMCIKTWFAMGKITASSGARTREAFDQSVGQRLTYRATGAPPTLE